MSTLQPSSDESLTARPAWRWESPFGEMSDADIRSVLKKEPFRSICPDFEQSKEERFYSFGAPVSIYGILKYDARIRTFKKGEFIMRCDDYGNSAFFLLEGGVCAVIRPSLPERLLGRREPRNEGYLSATWSVFRNSFRRSHPEFRPPKPTREENVHLGASVTDAQLESIVNGGEYETVSIQEGSVFGEIGAVYRMPREATVIAESDSRVIELRWQGLRDLMEVDSSIEQHVDEMYRIRSLKNTLDSIPDFADLPQSALDQITFHTYGKYDEWSSDYIDMSEEERVKVIAREDIIAREGDYPNGVFIIRAGFGRVSRVVGHGHRTMNYLTTGRVFGLSEAVHNWRNPEDPVPLANSLRAIGYTHVLFVPTPIFEEHIIPRIVKSEREELMHGEGNGIDASNSEAEQLRGRIGADLYEFFAENRFLNGTRTMLIDLDRCTRCDDCVRGCAAAHDNNPRFLRSGPVSNQIMVANSCMHCADPVCMIGCPTGAIHRESYQGLVVINDSTCIGCSTCASNCPYEAIRMVPIRNEDGGFEISTEGDAPGSPIYKATKCDFCLDQAGGPACVRACPHDALVRMHMLDTEELARFIDR